MKREDYISWDEYFIGVAKLSGKRSKDPSTQVGACIVNDENRIVGIGYNGFPRGCEDDEYPWVNNGDGLNLDTKYPYVVHAEVNAILNSTTRLKNARLYVTLFPCHECAKMIIQAGITEVVYVSDKYAHTASVMASKKMFNSAGVRLRQIPDFTTAL